jgi:hypothetical protein
MVLEEGQRRGGILDMGEMHVARKERRRIGSGEYLDES